MQLNHFDNTLVIRVDTKVSREGGGACGLKFLRGRVNPSRQISGGVLGF